MAKLQVATIAVLLLAVFPSIIRADPDMLQDICVADRNSPITVNGFVCKNNDYVTADDFFFAGLANAGNTGANIFGSLVTPANVEQIAGLNTLGVSMARIDYAVGGINSPHTHPRATEIIFVMEGILDVGFITTDNKLITKTIKKGENFVFPKGLVHFQKNAGYAPASVIAAFNSQLGGTVNIALTLFDSNPPIADDILAKTLQINNYQVREIKSKFM